jgi:hypothetical protein
LKIKSFKEVNLRNEQKYVSYLMRHLNQSRDLSLDNILNLNIKNIITAIQQLSSKNLSYSHDELLIFLSEIDETIDKTQLENIYNAFDNFDNIEFVKKEIIDCYLKSCINQNILEDILVNTTKSGELDKKKLKELGNYLIYNVSEIENKLNIKTAEDLACNYIKTLDKREKGEIHRSLGFEPLNKAITRPAAEGEMTGLVSFKGMAKSIFTKSINNLKINKGEPVLDLDLEMTEVSSIDRLMAMRGGHSLPFLLMKEKEQKLKNALMRDIELFKRNPYYLYFNEANITLDDFDALISKAKTMFIKKGILKSEEDYIFVTADLLELIEDFSIPKMEKLIPAINKCHGIMKKQNSHLFFTLQANENKIRSVRFDKPEDLAYYKIGLEDIFGSAVYAGRARVMLSLQRPRHLKYMFFPDRIDEWELEEDLINCHCIKQNDGPLFFHQYVFGKNFKIYPRIEKDE